MTVNVGHLCLQRNEHLVDRVEARVDLRLRGGETGADHTPARLQVGANGVDLALETVHSSFHQGHR